MAPVRKKTAISDTMLALYNRLQRDKFRAVPASRRILFLPHCLRKPRGCRADNTPDGLVCKRCSPDCSVNRLSAYAVSKGYRCFIVPGGEMLFNIVERERPGGIIGVACHHEMGQAADRITGGESSVPFAYQGVTLRKSGCVDTKVNEAAVMAVIDLSGPSPGAAPSVPSEAAGLSRRTIYKRAGGVAAAVTVALAAMFLLLPGLFPAALERPSAPEPAISYSSNPTARYYKDQGGNPWAEVKATVHNGGPGEARNMLVRATAFYCGKPFEPDKGGVQVVPLNGTLKAGGRAEALVQVRVHGFNDTSITVETLRHNMVELVGVIKAPKAVFLRNAGVTGYEVSLSSGKRANLSVQVYNEGPGRSSGSLRIVATSYSSFGVWTGTAEVAQERFLPSGDTWTSNFQVKVSELDPGHPRFSVELYEGQSQLPTDVAWFDG